MIFAAIWRKMVLMYNSILRIAGCCFRDWQSYVCPFMILSLARFFYKKTNLIMYSFPRMANWWLTRSGALQNDNQVKRASALSRQVCPSSSLNVEGNIGPSAESACHVPDVRQDHRCKNHEECGSDSLSCRERTCSIAGYCGLWLAVWSW